MNVFLDDTEISVVRRALRRLRRETQHKLDNRERPFVPGPGQIDANAAAVATIDALFDKLSDDSDDIGEAVVTRKVMR